MSEEQEERGRVQMTNESILDEADRWLLVGGIEPNRADIGVAQPTVPAEPYKTFDQI